MLNFTKYKMSAARNRSEKPKQSPQHKGGRSIERNYEEEQKNMKNETFPVQKKFISQ